MPTYLHDFWPFVFYSGEAPPKKSSVSKQQTNTLAYSLSVQLTALGPIIRSTANTIVLFFIIVRTGGGDTWCWAGALPPRTTFFVPVADLILLLFLVSCCCCSCVSHLCVVWPCKKKEEKKKNRRIAQIISQESTHLFRSLPNCVFEATVSKFLLDFYFCSTEIL